MTRLSELVSHHIPAGVTHRELTAAINAHGSEKVGETWVYRIMNGTHAPKLRESKLRAMADYLGIPMEDMRMAAGVPAGETEPFSLPAEADRLDDEQREVIRHMVRVLLRDNTGRQDDDRHDEYPEATPINAARVAERPRPVADQKKAAKRPHPNVAPDEEAHTT